METRDKCGNEFQAGDYLWFDALQGIVEVLEVQQPGIVDKDKPGKIIIKVEIPFKAEEGGDKGAVFGFFLKSHKPPDLRKTFAPPSPSELSRVNDAIAKARSGIRRN